MGSQYQSTVEEEVDTRRRALRLTWRKLGSLAGVSHETLRRLRAGEPVSDVTEAGVEQALSWEPGSIELIRRGGTPATREEAEAVDRWREQGEFDAAHPPAGKVRAMSSQKESPSTSQMELKFAEWQRHQGEQHAELSEQGQTMTLVSIMGPDGSSVVEVVHDKERPPSGASLLRGFIKALESFTAQSERNQEARDGRNPPPIRPRSSQDHYR